MHREVTLYGQEKFKLKYIKLEERKRQTAKEVVLQF